MTQEQLADIKKRIEQGRQEWAKLYRDYNRQIRGDEYTREYDKEHHIGWYSRYYTSRREGSNDDKRAGI